MKQDSHWPERFLATFALCGGTWVALSSPDLCWFNTHMARDFMRAMDWLHGSPQWGGPELNYNGGHLFGPFVYLVWALLWSLTRSLPAMLELKHILTCTLSIFLAFRLRRECGPACAWSFFLSFFLMPVHVSLSRTLWNPSLILPVNIAIILCVWASVLRPKERKFRVIFGLLAFAGIQIHLATLPGILAGTITLWRRYGNRERQELTMGLSLLVAYVATFKLILNEGTSYVASLQAQYHWPRLAWATAAKYLQMWKYHLHVDSNPLQDYELFPVLFAYGKELFPTHWAFVHLFEQLSSLVVAMWFILVFLPAFREAPTPQNEDSPRILRELSGVWLLITLVPMIFYTAKDGVIPYRYGLMLYPIQFLLPSLNIGRLPRAWRHAALSLCVLLFVGDAATLLLTYRAMEASGRASHVSCDNDELPLRYKLEILRLSIANSDESPYEAIHGPIANKIRFKEHDWDCTVRYGALVSSLEPCPQLPKEKRHDYAIESKNLDEMKQTRGERFPFRLVPLEAADLPQRLHIRHRRENREILCSYPWTNPREILPLALDISRHSKELEIQADLAPGAKAHLRICYDGSHSEGYPQGATLELQQVEIDGAKVVFAPFSDGWQAQCCATIPLPRDGKDHQLHALFKVLQPTHRLSRLDIFCTNDARPFSPLKEPIP